MRKTSNAELRLCRTLHLLLSSLIVSSEINDSPNRQNMLSALARFIPEVMLEIHSEWKYRAIDDIYPALMKKTGDNEIELIGLCADLPDQTLAPLFINLQLDSELDEVSWF